MKGKTAGLSILTVGAIGGLLWYLSKGTSISNAVKSLQFRNPKIKFGSPGLLSIPANISLQVFNPTSTDVPVDYLSGNIVYNGKNLSSFQVDGKASNLKIKGQSTTSVPFTVNISNLNSVSAITNIISNLFGGYSAPIVLQVTGIFFALGMDIPYSFYYDIVNQKVVNPGTAISGKSMVNSIAGFSKSKAYSVTYDKKMGGVGNIIVKARNEYEALSNAKDLCFTGRNFRDAIETEVKYTKPRKQGFYGRN